MQPSRPKAHVSRYIDEDESYWKNHLSRFRLSGLSRKEYCRQNGIGYDRFGYWMDKLAAPQAQVSSKQLLPVQIKPEQKVSDTGSLLSLVLRNGCILQIHNSEALSIILEKLL